MSIDKKIFKIVEEVKREYKKGNKIGRKKLRKLYNLSDNEARKIIQIVEWELFIENELENYDENKIFIRKIKQFEKILDKEKNKNETKSIKEKSRDNKNGEVRDESYLLLLSDWHIGEVVDEREINYINKYDIKVATRRVELIYEKVRDVVGSSSNKEQELFVWLGGDMVSGVIHDELLYTNVLTITDQILVTSQLLYQLLEDLSRLFKNIYIVTSVGNHGRITKKKTSKQKSNNYDFLAYKILYFMLKDNKKIKWYITKELFSFVEINGYNFVFSHGDTIRMWNNIPYYGIIRDLQVKQSISQVVNRSNSKVDYYVIGHFHTPSSLNVNGIYVIMNGSLKGIDEFSLQKGFISIPSQKLLKITKNQGVFIQYDLILSEDTIYQEPQRYSIVV